MYLGIMTRPAINRQDTFKTFCMQEQLRIMNIIYLKHGKLTVSGKINMHDGIAEQVFELAYYKAL